MDVMHVTDTDFEEKVLKSSKPVVVDFSAEWCMPCKIMEPVFDECSGEIEGIDFMRADVDQCGATASKYNVLSVPTLILFVNGEVKNQISGAMQKPKLKEWLDESVKETAVGREKY